MLSLLVFAVVEQPNIVHQAREMSGGGGYERSGQTADVRSIEQFGKRSSLTELREP